jgi:uncharacterized membrane protein
VSRTARDERGAAALLIALLISSVLLVSASFAVDIGMQRVARTDAQTLADVVALDLAQELNKGKTLAQLTAAGQDQALANATRDRNSSVLGTHQGRRPTVDVAWGVMEDGSFKEYVRPADDAKIPTAVRVLARTETGFSIKVAKTGKAQRRAVASADKGACFRIGSFIARVKSGDSALLATLLGGLLGSNLDATVGGYTGLADANVSLLDLVKTGQLGVGSVSELLKADQIKVADLIGASLDVLSSPGHGASAATVNALGAIKAAAVLSGLTIKIADLISAAPSDPAALASSVNVLDLVTGAIIVANKDHLIDIPGLKVGPIAGVTATTALKVIEGPRKVCSGDPTDLAHTAQVQLTTTIHSDARDIGVSIGGLASAKVHVDEINLTLETRLAQANAKLLSLNNCDATGAESVTFQVNSAAVGVPTLTSGTIHASVSGDLLTGTGASASLIDSLLSGLSGILSPLAPIVAVNSTILKGAHISLDVNAGVQLNGTPGVAPTDPTYTVDAPHWDLANPTAFTVPGTLIPSISAFSLTPLSVVVGGTFSTQQALVVLLGVPISLGPLVTKPLNSLVAGLSTQLQGVVTSAVTPLLNGLISDLQTKVINKVSAMLGLNIGGFDLWVEHQPRCGAPRLVR